MPNLKRPLPGVCLTFLLTCSVPSFGQTLTSDDFKAGAIEAPIDNSNFAVPENAVPAQHRLEGRLRLFDVLPTYFSALRDDFDRQDDNRISYLPELDIEVVQDGDHLVPTEQGLILTGHRSWNYVIATGRVWREPSDGEWSRAALPFSLNERSQNCVHNGVVSFLFKDGQVTDSVFQITQETCKYFKFDLAGSAPVRYQPVAVPERDNLLADHQKYLEGRLATGSLSRLSSDHPQAQVSLPALGTGMIREHLTTYGVVFDGVHYRSESRTRHGAYPFPELQVVPSYSLAKSVFGGFALMRLAEKYGTEVTQEKLRDHLPKVPKKRLQNVTFEHALDMATGHFREPGEQVDEADNYTELNFFLLESYNQKLRAALTYPTQEPPGQRWVYHTTDTLLLVNAISSYLAAKSDIPDAYRFVVEEIYQPLGLSKVAQKSLRTGNAEDGKPLGGFGLFLLPDDLAKLSEFINRDGGKIGEQQLLHPGILAAALQQNESDRGLEALHRGKENRYNKGFWAALENYSMGEPPEDVSIWLPRMLGYGGIGVFFLPNGATYYYVGDHDQHVWQPAVRELLELEDVR